MYLQHVAAGEDALRLGLALLVHPGTGGQRIHGNGGTAGQLVFRNQSDRQQQRIARDIAAGFLDDAALRVHLCHGDSLHALPAVNLRHRGGQIQGNSEILKALYDVAGQAAGIGQNLTDRLNLGPLQ